MQLMLGFAFVAIVPLAAAMWLLATRIQETVRTEAANRVNETLAILGAELAGDPARILGPLELLALDPAFRRRAAQAAPGDSGLRRAVMEKRAFIGFDVLEVLGPGGNVLAASRAGDGAEHRFGAEPADTLAAGEPLPPFEAPPARGALPPGVHFVPDDGDSAALRAGVVPLGGGAGTLRGGFRLDRAALARMRGSSGIDFALRDAAGRVLASSLAREEERFVALMEDPAAAGLPPGWIVRAVRLGGAADPVTLAAFASTAAADRTLAMLRTTAALLGGFALLLGVALGAFWARRVARPLETLTDFSTRVAAGRWEEPLTVDAFAEVETLAAALDRMREDLRVYRARLVAGERHAAWSQMARMIAHEVRNPLTPISVAIADLKRSHDQGRADFPAILAEAARVIAAEVESLKELLREFSEFGRMPAPVFADVRVAEVAADLGALYRAEVQAGRLRIEAPAAAASVRADRGQLRQALVNLVKNGLEAAGAGGRVEVAFEARPRELVVTVTDSGPGIGAEQRARLFTPEYTTKAGGSGLGLAIVARIVQDHGGAIAAQSEPGHGARFEVRLPSGGPGDLHGIDPDRR